MPRKLTHYKLCPRSRAIRIALSELGLDVTLLDESPWEWRQGFLAKNPAGELPVLEYDNGLTLCGGYSISEFLAEEAQVMQPQASIKPPQLFPGSREDRAEVRRLSDWFNGKMEREVTRELLFEKVYQRMNPAGAVAPDLDILRAARANLQYHLSYISYLADSRRWLAGDDMSFADFVAAGHLSVLDYLNEVPWSEYAPAKSWYQRMKSRPSFRTLLADRIPGTPPPLAYADLDF